MFEGSFLINLLIFVAGQATAYGYLRTGRKVRGIALMVLLLVFADVALVRVLAFQQRDIVFRLSLSLMQAYAFIELLLFATGRLRRRLPKVRQERDERFRSAFLHSIRNEMDAAIADYRGLLKLDPWDLESTLGLATALARSGNRKQARRYFRAARSLDLKDQYADVISDELRRFGVKRKKAASA